MRLQFKQQKFQSDAALAVCDVFAGQPYLTPSYLMDRGFAQVEQLSAPETSRYTGFSNSPLVPELTDEVALRNINKVQRSFQLEPSKQLEGRYNLTVEMETGVGKTYTYIKTMYELNKRYGWGKFIVVVPSVAIREGVYKSFQITEDHFAEEYGKKIRYFIYNSAQLTEIDRFASDSAINVMIINSQAFNARGKAARRIYMKLDEFRSRRPIDIIARTNPILIIDEPQSVEGTVTKERLKEFNPLFTLRYSATHRKDSLYNMIYRLDAMEAYNKKLVKKIAVKGISISGSTATEGYVYLESINVSSDNPTATIEFDKKGTKNIRKVRHIVKEGHNLFDRSEELEAYRDGYTVLKIDGRDSSIEFINGIKLYVGDVIGAVSEDHLRRIQIRETILSHLEQERRLFAKGIKVLSLFFIDEVAKYKQYDAKGQAQNGPYADMFEEEYKEIFGRMQLEFSDAPAYLSYLEGISPGATHAGYFSIDKRSRRLVDSKLGDRRERTSDDVDAYDLIMRDKERLLGRAEPVRFIFSHSALREGWDNPNVFQICTLKQSGSEVRKRQEVGRGLRLAVDQNGQRMDSNLLGEDFHSVNVLTVVANESYESFAQGLQRELVEAIAHRPQRITVELFVDKVIKDKSGTERVVDLDLAQVIYEGLITEGYVRKGVLSDKYYEDKKSGRIALAEEVADCQDSVAAILDSIYDSRLLQPENARKNNVDLRLDKAKLGMKEFQKLWGQINAKSVYTVHFDEEELIAKAIAALNQRLQVAKIHITVVAGELKQIESREQLERGEAFTREKSAVYTAQAAASAGVKFDLIGKIVNETGLTRKAIASILSGIKQCVFDQFADNPEEFILKASQLINEEKATTIIEHIAYNKLEEVYTTDIFTEPDLKGQLGVNVMAANKHLYDHILYDSEVERNFAQSIDTSDEVAVYVKLPRGFYISTPVGKYTPDWAIAFYEGTVKHIYFIAETKGTMSTLELRGLANAKAHCAREHFKSISTGTVVYDVVDSYEALLAKVMA